MPKYTPKVGPGAVTAEPDGPGRYVGEMPPEGTYRCTLRWLAVKPDKNGDDRFSGPAVINEPDSSPKSKYNGYTIWIGQSLNDEKAGYFNNMLDGLAVDRKAFYASKVVVDDNDPPNVTKIGAKRIENIDLYVAAGSGKDKDGKLNLQAVRHISIEAFEADADADVDADEPEEDAPEPDEPEAEEAEDEPEEDADEAEEGDDQPWTAAELEALSRPELTATAKDYGVKVTAKMPSSRIVAGILAAQDDAPDEEVAPF